MFMPVMFIEEVVEIGVIEPVVFPRVVPADEPVPTDAGAAILESAAAV